MNASRFSLGYRKGIRGTDFVFQFGWFFLEGPRREFLVAVGLSDQHLFNRFSAHIECLVAALHHEPVDAVQSGSLLVVANFSRQNHNGLFIRIVQCCRSIVIDPQEFVLARQKFRFHTLVVRNVLEDIPSSRFHWDESRQSAFGFVASWFQDQIGRYWLHHSRLQEVSDDHCKYESQ